MVHIYSSLTYSANLTWTTAFLISWAALKRKQRRKRILEEADAHRNEDPLGSGGRGGTLPYRRPRNRYPNLTGKEARILRPEMTQWYYNYIENKEQAADPESVIGKEFRAKFRVPYSMFEEILKATRDLGLFPDDEIRSSGQKPHPLSMKVMACLRRMALGIPISSLEDMCGISDAVLSKFIDVWSCWFVRKYHSEWVKMTEGKNLKRRRRCLLDVGFPGLFLAWMLFL
jgi:hypothetical protein